MGNQKEVVSPEKEIEILTTIGNHALHEAKRMHDALWFLGLEEVGKNQYGESSLRVDTGCEATVIRVLETYGIPIMIFSEEHGIKILGKGKPQYIGILDGLDGSRVYREFMQKLLNKEKIKEGEGRYGTMFAIYKTGDPSYDDYIYGGIMEHNAHTLYYASRDNGSFMRVQQNPPQRLRALSGQELGENMRKIYGDPNLDIYTRTSTVRNILSKFAGYTTTSIENCCSMQFVDLLLGRVAGTVECTRKGNLELAVAYALLREMGAVMLDLQGESLGSKKYLEFGQKTSEYIPVISAYTADLGEEFVRKINFSHVTE